MVMKRESFIKLVLEIDGIKQDKAYEGRTYLDVLKALNKFEMDYRHEIYLAANVVAHMFEINKIKQWSEEEFRWNVISEESKEFKKLVVKQSFPDSKNEIIHSNINTNIISTL